MTYLGGLTQVLSGMHPSETSESLPVLVGQYWLRSSGAMASRFEPHNKNVECTASTPGKWRRHDQSQGLSMSVIMVPNFQTPTFGATVPSFFFSCDKFVKKYTRQERSPSLHRITGSSHSNTQNHHLWPCPFGDY